MLLLWLATVWMIWQERKDMIFNIKVKYTPHMLEKVKYLSMWWLKKSVVNVSNEFFG